MPETTQQSWEESLKGFLHPSVITMLFLGLSAGIPILLIFSSLGLWLREAGVDRSTVTMFSWAALGYSFKFVWAPLVDRLPVPILTSLLGRRRAWILVSQFSIILAIVWMANTNPATGSNPLLMMAFATVLLGFSSATQDIVIDAYRIEAAKADLQAMMSSTYIAGYRIGMIIAGAGALFIADYFGSDMGEAYNYQAWFYAYMAMAAAMLIGVVTTLVIAEPEVDRDEDSEHNTSDYLGFLALFVFAVLGFIGMFLLTSGDTVKLIKDSMTEMFGNKALASFLIGTARLSLAITAAFIVAKIVLASNLINKEMVRSTYVAPIKDFFSRYGVNLALLLLALIGLYRISDIVLGVIANVFYQDLGYTKTQIASVVKTFGLFMTIAGGFLGGILSLRYGVMRILFVGAVLVVLTNLLFVVLARLGEPNIAMLYVVISADNISGGLASAAFIAFLSSLTNIKFTAVQYAIFSSLMTLLPKVIGGYSGSIVESFCEGESSCLVGYENFFIIASLIGIPVLLLVWLANKHLDIREFSLKGTSSN